MKEKCGVFGALIHGKENTNITEDVRKGIGQLLHRGQEGVSIVGFCDDYTVEGNPVSSIVYSAPLYFNDHGKLLYPNYCYSHFEDGSSALRYCPARTCSAHARYSTSGIKQKDPINPQPFLSRRRDFSLAHNGHIINAAELRKELLFKDIEFDTSESDTEVIIRLIEFEYYEGDSCKTTLIEAIKIALSRVKGSFSLIITTKDMMIGIKDRQGIKPLSYMSFTTKYGLEREYLSSETCAFKTDLTCKDLIGKTKVREILRGQAVICKKDCPTEFIQLITPACKSRPCIFELIYFSRSDSVIGNQKVSDFRYKSGRALAKRANFKANFIVPIPDSGIHAAQGYADESSILYYGDAIIKRSDSGRAFIEPTPEKRLKVLRNKFILSGGFEAGISVILVDDSLVRGDTLSYLASLLREAGIEKIYAAIACPPFKFPCYYGVDVPSNKELPAASLEPDEIAKKLGLDGLIFSDLEDLYKATIKRIKRIPKRLSFCDACFSGEYPKEIKKKYR